LTHTSFLLAQLIKRIRERKKSHKVVTAALLVNEWEKRLTKPALRNQFAIARKAAANGSPEIASAIEKCRLYDLSAKTADDTRDERGERAASDLLGHDNVKTTQRHLLAPRGRIVPPTE
jgi:integrase